MVSISFCIHPVINQSGQADQKKNTEEKCKEGVDPKCQNLLSIFTTAACPSPSSTAPAAPVAALTPSVSEVPCDWEGDTSKEVIIRW